MKLRDLERKLVERDKREKKKPFRMPWRVRSKMKKKKPQHVIVQYLTRDYEIRFQQCRIVGGNLVVLNNRVHVLNPKRIWSWGKKRLYILREIDRQPVSNEDYDKVIKRRDDTEADVPLIKAVLGAVQKQTAAVSKNTWIVIGVIAVIAIVLFFVFGR